MLNIENLGLKNFDYRKYIEENSLVSLLGLKNLPKKISKLIKNPDFSIDPNNKTPLPPELDDLCRLHFLTCSRNVMTILEFGLGKSTLIFGDALIRNKEKFKNQDLDKIRKKNIYECHSVDNYEFWINSCKEIIPQEMIDKKIINLHKSELHMAEHFGKICTLYDFLPNISPNLIYLDGPDQFSPEGNIRGISTDHPDRMPMSADILTFEHFLHPGTLLIIDGRTANARFLISNLRTRT